VGSVSAALGFQPPAYPYDRLAPAKAKADALAGGVVDLSIGTPVDPPPQAVLSALARSDEAGAVRGYPPSIGSPELRRAIAEWTERRLAALVSVDQLAVCVGTKEFVATLPQWLKLRSPGRDTVLYPAVAYPTYEMGALLAGLRPVAVPVDQGFHLNLDAISASDAERALLLWVNSPGNPAGQLDDLEAAAGWGRARGVLVASDECYAEYTWTGPPRTILDKAGTAGASFHHGVLALHSLSKRSNLAGARLGWYAGDGEIVGYLREVRKHAGFMVPGPVQAAGVAALGDQEHVEVQRTRYWERLVRLAAIFRALGIEARLPDGGFYLWVPAPGGDAWALTERLAAEGGMLVSPGDFYGAAGADRVRVAAVAPMERIELVAQRLGV
jgi:succinyldiaminopimelate transaminase